MKTITSAPTGGNTRAPKYPPAQVRPLFHASDIIRDSRMSICTALVSGGPESALAAVASSSIRLARWCAAGEMMWTTARKMLIQASCNLKLVHHFGKGAVHVAINAGPALYADIAAEIENKKQVAA
jgi:hypothetical protein